MLNISAYSKGLNVNLHMRNTENLLPSPKKESQMSLRTNFKKVIKNKLLAKDEIWYINVKVRLLSSSPIVRVTIPLNVKLLIGKRISIYLINNVCDHFVILQRKWGMEMRVLITLVRNVYFFPNGEKLIQQDI